MSVRYRIELGNCGDDINAGVKRPGEPEAAIYRSDTTVLKADSTIYTADYNL